MKTGIVFDQIVGMVLAHYRTKVAGLSQHQAIVGTSIGTSSLSRLEKGDYSLNMEQLFELSKSFGVDMSDVVASVESTRNNIENHDVHIAFEKKANTNILLLSTDSLTSMIVDEQAESIETHLEKNT
ncbi:MAG: helix-turn-helix transcriptional regulator [Gammaproteobacteria bacterium]|jgi:Helix-turn-helix.